ncbi:MAG: O-antigen ligase family protein [Desulfobulbaceae bacterium]
MKQTIPRTAGKINGLLMPLLAFALPLSTSAVSVLAVLVTLCWILEGNFKEKAGEIFRNGVCIALLLYLALHVIGLLWSEDFGDGSYLLTKQWKLLLFPVFLTGLRGEDRQKVIYGFLAGLGIMMAATYLAWLDLLHYGGVTPEHPTRKLFHVVYNPMLAFGFYLAMDEALKGGRPLGRRAGWTALALLMVFNMFITEGRTGQLAFFFMVLVLLLQQFRKKIAWGILTAMIVLPMLFAAGYRLSPTFHSRVQEAWKEVAQFNYNPQTSIGYRIHFWKISWRIFSEHPWLGVGTTDFKSFYYLMNREVSPRIQPTDNPHNQYLLVLCQFGIVGLAALLGIFALMIRDGLAIRDSLSRVRQAFPLFFLLIMMAESYLIISETGFLFSLFGAVLYKQVPMERHGDHGKGDGLQGEDR